MSIKDRKLEIELIKKIVDDEALNVFLNYNAEFEFRELDKEVKTVYVYELRESPKSVEFYMLDDMLARIKEINPRYAVGILFEEKDPTIDKFNELQQSFLSDSDEDF